MKHKLISLIVLLVSGLAFWNSAQRSVSADGAGFTIQAKQPDNQRDKKATYFDLDVKSGSKQDLKVVVHNLTNKTKTFKISPNDAFTNDNGVIEYSKRNLSKDKSAQYTFSELVSGVQTVNLSAKEKKTLTFKLSIPEKGFRGNILGGFYVTPLDKVEPNSKKGMVLQNKFAMLLGVSLHGKGTATPKLELGDVKPKVVNTQPVILANLKNVEPVAFGNLNVDAKVTKVNSDKVLYKNSKQKMQMAPNTNFNFQVPLDNEGFKAGEYTLHLTAKRKDKVWKFTKNFTIASNDTKLNNGLSNWKKPNYTWLYITIAVVVAIVGAGLAFFLGRRKR